MKVETYDGCQQGVVANMGAIMEPRSDEIVAKRMVKKQQIVVP